MEYKDLKPTGTTSSSNPPPMTDTTPPTFQDDYNPTRPQIRKDQRREARGQRLENRGKIWSNAGSKLSDITGGRLGRNLTNRGDYLTEKGGRLRDWYPGKRVDEGFDAAGNIAEKVNQIRDLGKYLPYGEELNWAKGELGKVDPFSVNIGTNVTGNLKPGQQSVAGDYYSDNESAALGGLNRFIEQGGAREQLGTDLLAFKGNLANQKSDIERAYEQNLLNVQKGNLDPASNEYIKAMNAKLDLAAQDERRNMRESLGASRGLSGGRRDLMERDLANRQTAEKMGVLGNTYMNMMNKTQDFINTNKYFESAMSGIAADLAKQSGANQIGASKAVADHVINAGNLQMQQMGLQLQEQLANIQNQFEQQKMQLEKAGAGFDVAKWQNEYDIAQRDSIGNMLNNLFDLMPGGEGMVDMGQSASNPILSGLRK